MSQLLMTQIPSEPVVSIVIGLSLITLLVLLLPFLVKRIEENLELFFLSMGILAVTISGLWSWELVMEALKAPVMIGVIPIGIFQVVLVFGLIIHFYHEAFCLGIIKIASRMGSYIFISILILVTGLLSSVISVIVTAVLLSEVISALPLEKMARVKLAVVSCFAVGLGACLTPIGEPLSTILVAKLSGPPYYADFLFPLRVFGIYIIPGVLLMAVFGAFFIGKNIKLKILKHKIEYTETIKTVIVRSIRVFFFVAALILLGEGLKPLVIWYFVHIPASALYWINILSAILDNATLTAVEIGPTMELKQITGIILGLLIAGGMLIPGNIPNIVAAARLKISMKEWAIIGIPLGLAIMAIYFIVMLPLFFS
ncbi:MAG: DUF1646 family protein [Dehalococcoidia bacterium]|nr:DUF1646 family protein [Dehalococcoidia bacterium]